MNLDPFDMQVLTAKCNAVDFMREYYGVKLSESNAVKQKTGILRHLRTKRRMDTPVAADLDKLITKADGTQTSVRMLMLSEEDRKDPNRVMELMGYDPAKWECVKLLTNLNDWNVTMKMQEYDLNSKYRKGAESNSRTWAEKHTNHQYKVEITLKPRQDLISSEAIRTIFSELEPPALNEIEYQGGSMLFELSMMDLHLDKYADAAETGDDYNLEIAKRLYKLTVNDLLGKLKIISGLKFESIVLPFGQDFFHYDTKDRKTTKGTQVESDGPFYKMFDAGLDLMIWTVEQCRQLAPVEILYVPGNHDWTLAYFAVAALGKYYEQIDGVTVDLSPAPRKYKRFGINLIGWSHGKEGKRIQHLMQQEQPEDWGRTQIREWHLGDLHHEEAEEIGGVIIRRMSSITAVDSWHAEKGYRATRKAEAFVWDKAGGKAYTISSYVGV